ncbi:phosphate signaling complex protein PhoU [Pseudonocardia kujensis]|uniref:phosphate signaling complex protein PhoU n=1 Tax=Pseudonocardia kujensis TaxID=1128675 RepID=UPI001E4021BD|nr:phosphate signaling complex protein PhoU [Pseudonocardia kujensis]MCE0765416.1 phosphate signaling complex protein PhoU [Pseudonocardia kujensis]
MRDAYTEQIDDLVALLTSMCTDVAIALDKATRALVQSDAVLAQEVVDEDAGIDLTWHEAEEKAFELLVLQAPLATDLRIVVAAIHTAADIQRMGALAEHIAEAVLRRRPEPVLPAEVAGFFGEMGRVGVELARKAVEVMESRDPVKAAQLEADDDAMDDLHEHMSRQLMDRNWPHGVEAAVDAVLLARFYERYADHAVAIARRIIYVVTGQMPGPLSL